MQRTYAHNYKEKLMVKPLGIVAMLTLLASGPAMASEKLFTKQINTWGITTHGNLYLETKKGDKYIGNIQHCPVIKTPHTYENTNFSPAMIVAEMSKPHLRLEGRFVSENDRLMLVDRSRKGTRSAVAKCVLGEVRKIS